jgi:hypothetical protein
MSGSEDLPEIITSAEKPAFLFPPLITVRRSETNIEILKLAELTIFELTLEEAVS